MTAVWTDEMPDRSRADRRDVVKLGLAVIGAGTVPRSDIVAPRRCCDEGE